MVESDTTPPPKPGHADTLKPSRSRVDASKGAQDKVSGISQAEMLSQDDNNEDKAQNGIGASSGGERKTYGASPYEGVATAQHSPSSDSVDAHQEDDLKPKLGSASSAETALGRDDSWEPKPPKVMMEDPNATPLELRSQIQHYATNEYVCRILPVFSATG